MRQRCEKIMRRVYRRADGLPLSTGSRSMLPLSFALLISTCVLLLPLDGAMAQPAPAPVAQSAAPPDAKSDTKRDVKTDAPPGMSSSDISAAREQQRTTAATRQQIQAIRAALRARLAAMQR